MYYAILAIMVASSFLIADIGDGVRVPKELACIIGFTLIYFIPTKRRPFKSVWLKGFVLWGFVLTGVFVKSVKCMYELYYVLAAFLAISALASTETLIPNELNLRLIKIKPMRTSFDHQIQGIMRFACWLAVVMASYIYIQAIGLDSINIVKGFHEPGAGTFAHRIIGTLGNPTVVASWFAIIIPFFLFQKEKKFIFWMAYCMVALGMTGSIVGIAAALVGITVAALYKSKRVFYVLLVGGIIALTFLCISPKAKEFANPNGRIKAWKLIYKAWTKGYDNPAYKDQYGNPIKVKSKAFFGYGPGTFRYIIPGLTDDVSFTSGTPWAEAHNDPLEIGFNYGVVGLLLYMGLCFSVIGLFLRQKKTEVKVALFASLMAFSFSSFGFFPMHIGATAFLGVISLGLLMNVLTRGGKYAKATNIRNYCMRAFTMR